MVRPLLVRFQTLIKSLRLRANFSSEAQTLLAYDPRGPIGTCPTAILMTLHGGLSGQRALL